MKRWSRAHTLVAGSVIIAATNLVALAGAAYNRSGTPESTLQLSERELRVPSSRGFEGENSGIALDIRWRVLGREPDEARAGRPYYPLSVGPPEWLDSGKLAELGFDVASVEDATGTRSRYVRQLPREVLLVLELDGPAYQEMLARAEAYAERADSGRDRLAREKREGSRLFVVDAGLDVEKLRRKYPSRSRYAIVRGTIRPWVVSRDGHSSLTGRVRGLSVMRINVPFAFRAPFERRMDRRSRGRVDEPFTVTVAFGRRLEPWIVSASGSEGAR